MEYGLVLLPHSTRFWGSIQSLACSPCGELNMLSVWVLWFLLTSQDWYSIQNYIPTSTDRDKLMP